MLKAAAVLVGDNHVFVTIENVDLGIGIERLNVFEQQVGVDVVIVIQEAAAITMSSSQ